jgi:segregation and condensation protein B
MTTGQIHDGVVGDGTDLEVSAPALTEPADTELADTELADTELADTELADTELADTELADTELRGTLEAVLLVVDEPVPSARLAAGLGVPEPRVLDMLERLRAELRDRQSGIALREIAGGWRFYTAEEYADAVGEFLLDGQSARLSQAALETLAVIAYQQPIARARIAAVRGVNVDGVVRTLVLRGLVAERGTEEGSGALLYGTTALFLERLGLRDVSELPALAPLLPDLGGLSEADMERRPPGRTQAPEDAAAGAEEAVEPAGSADADEPDGSPDPVDD